MTMQRRWISQPWFDKCIMEKRLVVCSLVVQCTSVSSRSLSFSKDVSTLIFTSLLLFFFFRRLHGPKTKSSRTGLNFLREFEHEANQSAHSSNCMKTLLLHTCFILEFSPFQDSNIRPTSQQKSKTLIETADLFPEFLERQWLDEVESLCSAGQLVSSSDLLKPFS